MSANPDSDPRTDADSQTPHNSAPAGVEDLRGLLMRLQTPQIYTEPSVVQTDICIDREKLGVNITAVYSPEVTLKNMENMDDLSSVFSRLGWLFNEGTGLIDLSHPCFEIGYMLKPIYIDKPTIKPQDITIKMDFLLKQIIYFDVNVRKQNSTLRQLIQYAVKGIESWKKIQWIPQTPTLPHQAVLSVPPHLQKPQVHNQQPEHAQVLQRYHKLDRKYNEAWFAWTSGNTIFYTKNGLDIQHDLRSKWVEFKDSQGKIYLKPFHGLDCYKFIPIPYSQKNQTPQAYPQNINPPKYTSNTTFIPWRQNTYGQNPGVYRDQNGHAYQVRNKLASQESTSDLADPVNQVRPCRCEGCPGCDGTPGHCRCTGRCRCADAY